MGIDDCDDGRRAVLRGAASVSPAPFGPVVVQTRQGRLGSPRRRRDGRQSGGQDERRRLKTGETYGQGGPRRVLLSERSTRSVPDAVTIPVRFGIDVAHLIATERRERSRSAPSLWPVCGQPHAGRLGHIGSVVQAWRRRMSRQGEGAFRAFSSLPLVATARRRRQSFERSCGGRLG